MNDATKGAMTRSDVECDRGRFAESIRAVRSELDAVEAGCVDDVVFRDVVAVACESIRLQLAMINRRCGAGADEGGLLRSTRALTEAASPRAASPSSSSGEGASVAARGGPST